MQPILKRSQELKAALDAALDKIKLEPKQAKLAELDQHLAQPEIWHNPTEAQRLTKQAAALRSSLDPWLTLKGQVNDIDELIGLGDESMAAEFGGQLDALEMEFAHLKKDLQFAGPFDDHNAIVKVTAGAGGTDAQDWADMLGRMYLRWAEATGLSCDVVERSTGDEAGIKSLTLEINGAYAYGKLAGEHGIHRLVRLSPFNADNLRQTSFARVEVMPEIDAPDEVELDDKDLKIDVYRAGGHGGQSVNTTDSAVRITHLPTGTVVAIQNERSQLQNKETALKILRSKLAQLKLEQHQDDLKSIKGEAQEAAWGNQIRNYVLHPYKLVKDTRTGHQEGDAEAVLSGKLDGFIESYLEHNSGTGQQG
ncbi:MAG TPA: peptide chain release factor 2 [Candidatus Saccharimonadales bacterium]|nr:peptide chain release factor 2 [Candidatus Saccharimonadales bacterium]